MITTWISVSLLALTGWQGYRLGKEYGWWGSQAATHKKRQVVPPSPETASTEENGLGRSRTDFDRLLTGFRPSKDMSTLPTPNEMSGEQDLMEGSQAIIEPSTTLMSLEEIANETGYPEETDQVPETCNWMDEEAILLVEGEEDKESNIEQPMLALNDYVKRVHTVQRKMTQLTKRRNADSTFVKQELEMLIETYQLENDQSLEWLFRESGTTAQMDYGSIFDRIEKLSN